MIASRVRAPDRCRDRCFPPARRDPARRLPAAGLAGAACRARLRPRPRPHAGPRPPVGAPQRPPRPPAAPRRRGARAAGTGDRRPGAGSGTGAARTRGPGDRDRRRRGGRGDRGGHGAGGQHRAGGPLRGGRFPAHAVRGTGLPPHHLFHRPPGRDGALHHGTARRPRALPGAAGQWRPRGGRRTARRPPLRVLARPAPEAVVPVRPGRRPLRPRRGSLHHRGRPRGAAARARRPGARTALQACIGGAQAHDGLGRGALRPLLRPRALQHRRHPRLQHGRDGEQGSQHLQRQVHPGRPRDQHRRRLPARRGGGRARIPAQLDRQPRDLPRLVPAVAEGRPDRVPRTAVRGRHPFGRGAADRRRAQPARAAVPGGRGPVRPSGAAGRVRRDQQLLHRDGVREGRGIGPHAARHAGRDRLPRRHGRILPAPRRSGRHLRRLPRRAVGRRRSRSFVLRRMVCAGRHAMPAGGFVPRPDVAALHAGPFAAHVAHARPDCEAGASDPGAHRVARRARRAPAAASGRRAGARGHRARAASDRGGRALRVRGHRRAADPVAAARFLGAGGGRTSGGRRRTRVPRAPRRRLLQPLGGAAAARRTGDPGRLPW